MDKNFKSFLKEVFGKYSADLSGQVSQAFPALSAVDPDSFAISAVTVDGEVFEQGEVSRDFTIQSISKAFSFALALEQHGSLFVESKVGMEPTGEDYDTIIKLDDKNRPFNPMVNSGAIVMSGLINPREKATREEELLDYFGKFAGRSLKIDEATYRSENENGHKNWAIAHLLRHFNILTKEYREVLDLYFKQCSILVNTHDLALMGATLANDGQNPVTGVKCLSSENLRHVLSILFTCGMYNYSGEWAFDVGLPAKSGISGGILLVVPGVLGMAIYSPRLDKRGNSIRGIKVSEELSNRFQLHVLDYTRKKARIN
jgi:glutaminase